MSDLIPNLSDLEAHLPTDSSAQDTHEFLSELAGASSQSDIDDCVDDLLDRWLEAADDRHS